nr:ATP-binding cassette domain-containing protein [Ezakiella coagulans]
MLEIKNLSFAYKNRTIIDDLTIKFYDGINFVVGKNGSGKSTLLKIMSLVLPMDAGDVILNGTSIYNKEKYREKISYIPQEFNAFQKFTVNEFLNIVCKEKNAEYSMIPYYIEKCKLQDYEKMLGGELSVGFKKRLLVAASLISEPELIIADEPTAGLDGDFREEFNNMLKDSIADNKDLIVIYSSHIEDDIWNPENIRLKL